MIQRIQTLYLLILTALTAVTIFAPLAWFAGEMGEFRLYSFSLQSLDGSVSQSTAYICCITSRTPTWASCSCWPACFRS